MQSYTNTARPGGIRSFFRRAEGWMDARGTWAWIAATVLGFVVFWPVGLALLAYLIWGKRMFSRSCGQRRHLDDRTHAWGRHAMHPAQPTGNNAFDSYKADALRRLEEEQDAFGSFLQRLRNSKDKTEFDAFMEERARSTLEQDAPAADPKPADASRPGEY